MKLLALETTGKVCSIAVADNEKIIGELNINNGYTHSQTLLPNISALLSMINLHANDIDYVACSVGPGSFTGIKIGMATAKAFAHALNIPLIAVNALDGLANNIVCEKVIVPIMDARREQVYAAVYQHSNRMTDYLNDNIHEIVKLALSFGDEIIFLGDGVSSYKHILKTHPNISFVPEHLNLQHASSIANVAFNLQNVSSYLDIEPFYLREVI